MCIDEIRSQLKRFNGGSTMFCIMYRVKSNEIFVFHYNLLLLGSIWSNPVFKPLSFFLSDRHTLNSTRFDLCRHISGWGSHPEHVTVMIASNVIILSCLATPYPEA